MENEDHTSKPRTYRCSCKRCYNVWQSEVSEPLQCPRCKSFLWDVEPEVYHCNVCGTAWKNRTPSLPDKCPQCGSDDIDTGLLPEDQSFESRVKKLYDSGVGCTRICMKLHASMAQVQNVLKSVYPDNDGFKM